MFCLHENCGEPLQATQGRFWALAQESDADDTEDEYGETPVATPTVGSLTYVCRTPAEEACGLAELANSAIRRREEKKRRQREAAKTLQSGEYSFLFDDALLPSASRFTTKKHILPVLSPSTFALENFDAAEWISVYQRKRRAQMARRIRHRSASVSDHTSVKDPIQIQKQMNYLGQLGHEHVVSRYAQLQGRMGLGQSTRLKPVCHRLHFDRGTRRTLGFGFANTVPQLIARAVSSMGILAAAMASRGGGGNNHGRAPPSGGCSGGRWEGGPNGGRTQYE
jgi:hypothetical protein